MSIDMSTYLSIIKLKVRGQFHAARGDEEGARADFDATIDIFEDLGSRLELGWTLVLQARLAPNSDEDTENARKLFEACGAAGEFAGL
jgi:hypothetical protein